jgi:hypothetical protein
VLAESGKARLRGLREGHVATDELLEADGANCRDSNPDQRSDADHGLTEEKH